MTRGFYQLLAILLLLIAAAGAYLYVTKPGIFNKSSSTIATTTATTDTSQSIASDSNSSVNDTTHPDSSFSTSPSSGVASKYFISVYPTSGAAPFTASFTTNAQGLGYALDFGDGTAVAVGIGNCGVTRDQDCGESHTYASPGTYAVKLVQADCANVGKGGYNVPCTIPDNATILSTATVTVTSGSTPHTTGGRTATPTSGTAPLIVVFTTTGSQYESSGLIDFGDGSSERIQTLFGNGTSDNAGYCGAAPDFFCYIPHTYINPGTYTAAIVMPNTSISEGWNIIVTK